MSVDSKCAVCNKYLRKLQGFKKTVNSESDVNIISDATGINVHIGNTICNNCRLKVTKKSKQDFALSPTASTTSSFSSASDPSSESSSSDVTFKIAEENSPLSKEYVEMAIKRVISTHRVCCICGTEGKLIMVPFDARIQSFVKRRLYIPQGNRCCPNHIIKNRFFEDDLQSLRIYSNSSVIEVSEITTLLEHLSTNSNLSTLDKFINGALPADQFEVFTGLNWDQLNHLRNMLTSMRDSSVRTVIQALIVFLFKLKSGNSNKMIASILGLKQEQLVSEYTHSVMSAFEKDVLPYHFGLEALSRETLIQQHTSEMAKQLYDVHNKLIIICDGTYIRHQKSSNNDYQRKSYSGQKKVPLCKPFTICTTDGFIIDMLGPYLANENDANILKHIMNNLNGLPKLLEGGDIFVVDRGFRDIKSDLEEKSFKVLMPALKGKRSQLSTEESNESRFITKLRWVVESVHGMIKQKYKLLDQKLDNKMLPKVKLYCRIACFLLNTYGKRLNSDKDTADEVIQMMVAQKHIQNSLADEVEMQRWARRKVPFQTVESSELLDFPEMTERELNLIWQR